MIRRTTIHFAGYDGVKLENDALALWVTQSVGPRIIGVALQGGANLSPDGQYIAFFTDRNGKWELYVMEADGSNQRPMLVLSSVEGFETALDGLEFEYGFVAERMVSWAE